MTVGSLNQKSAKKAFGTIGAGPVRYAQATKSAPSPKPWDSEIFAPEPMQPSPQSVDKPKAAPAAPKKDKRRKSTINRGADRQLGQLEDEGY